jgi:hypothetical protein
MLGKEDFAAGTSWTYVEADTLREALDHRLLQPAPGGLGKLLGDVVVVAPLLDRLMHHEHLLKFEGKSWRLKEAAERVARQSAKS